MAEASTMFLTMKRLIALSLGTITPDASHLTRFTCNEQHETRMSPGPVPPRTTSRDQHTHPHCGPADVHGRGRSCSFLRFSSSSSWLLDAAADGSKEIGSGLVLF